MLIVPLQPVPRQLVNITLADQACQIVVAQKSTGIFLDLYVNDALVIGGVICENLNVIVRSLYLGFIGDLAFFDIGGKSDPFYSLIGTRFFLGYFTPAEVPFVEEITGEITDRNGIALENGLGFWEQENGSGLWLWG